MDATNDCGCASAFGRIEALVDGQLDSTECAAIRLHCESCNSCANELEIVDALTTKFRDALTEHCPEELRASILRSLDIVSDHRTQS